MASWGAELDRRRLLAAAGGAVAAGTLPAPPADGAGRARSVRAVSMAMHIHSSFSEGHGSMQAHLQQAREHGVDVVWWTEHDFRQYALSYRKAVRFNGPHEVEDGRAWDWLPLAPTGLAANGHEFVDSPVSPDEPGGSLRVHATAAPGDAWGSYLLQGNAWNFTYSTSYVDTVLLLDVRPGQRGTDAQTVVEIQSSLRPATAGRPLGRYRIQYRVGAPAGRWLEEDGILGVVGVPGRQIGGWQRLRMDLQADHDHFWPDTVRGDASLKSLRVGVRARRGATVVTHVDRLRFLRGRTTPASGRSLVAAAVQDYRDLFPRQVHYLAAEVSLVNHLNAFGGDGALPTYADDSLIKDETPEAQRAMARWLRRHGYVVSMNHPSPGKGGTPLARLLVSTRGNGCDLIEIGQSRKVAERIPSYDVAARNAVFLTATGVTDDHEGEDWLTPDGPRWVTCVWSPSKGRDDLCAALLAGRAWFRDPLYWRGVLELRLRDRAPMGGVLLTGAQHLDLAVRATRLPRGSRLDVVVGRCDRPGLGDLTPRTTTRVVPAADVVDGAWSTTINRGDGVYARVVVRRRDGTMVGFSNPVWALPRSLAGEVPIPRVRRYVDG